MEILSRCKGLCDKDSFRVRPCSTHRWRHPSLCPSECGTALWYVQLAWWEATAHRGSTGDARQLWDTKYYVAGSNPGDARRNSNQQSCFISTTCPCLGRTRFLQLMVRAFNCMCYWYSRLCIWYAQIFTKYIGRVSMHLGMVPRKDNIVNSWLLGE